MTKNTRNWTGDNLIEKYLDIEHIESEHKMEFTFIGNVCAQYRKNGEDFTETITRKKFDTWVNATKIHRSF
jgi:hypothetical protein